MNPIPSTKPLLPEVKKQDKTLHAEHSERQPVGEAVSIPQGEGRAHNRISPQHDQNLHTPAHGFEINTALLLSEMKVKGMLSDTFNQQLPSELVGELVGEIPHHD